MSRKNRFDAEGAARGGGEEGRRRAAGGEEGSQGPGHDHEAGGPGEVVQFFDSHCTFFLEHRPFSPSSGKE